MLVELVNEPRPYSWGDTGSIAAWRSVPPGGEPQAELWWGTHPGSPARVVGASPTERIFLSEWLEAAGHSGALPYLVKLLAAARPLSLQVHPTKAQAKKGFALEDAAGVSLDSRQRNYTDTSDKPELIIAWSESFEALVGFQDLATMEQTLNSIESLVADVSLTAGLRDAVEGGGESAILWLLRDSDAHRVLASALTEALAGAITETAREDESPTGSLARVWELVVPHFPGDPGILVASFLNYVALAQGEGVFVPAGIIHAYLKGFGLETMAPSDNVLRGGLSDKHIDREEISAIVVKETTPAELFVPRDVSPGLQESAPPGAPFRILHATDGVESLGVQGSGPCVVIVESGSHTLQDGDQNCALHQGLAYAWLPEAATASLRGAGSVFVVVPA